jgi:hypothetical protein
MILLNFNNFNSCFMVNSYWSKNGRKSTYGAAYMIYCRAITEWNLHLKLGYFVLNKNPKYLYVLWQFWPTTQVVILKYSQLLISPIRICNTSATYIAENHKCSMVYEIKLIMRTKITIMDMKKYCLK